MNNDVDLVSNEGILKWFSFDELQELEMPFTAKYVVEHYIKKGRYTKEMYVGITNEEKVEFLQLPES